ncbi:MAG TPA: type VI secretion system tube protein Hcp [Bryobacteraceae bacterium]|jgi:type VI protein secretion system component Hcp
MANAINTIAFPGSTRLTKAYNVDSWSWAPKHAATLPGVPIKAQPTDFTITRAVDDASQDLAMASAQGTLFPRVILAVTTALQVLSISLDDVLIASYSVGGGIERMSFTGTNIKVDLT